MKLKYILGTYSGDPINGYTYVLIPGTINPDVDSLDESIIVIPSGNITVGPLTGALIDAFVQGNPIYMQIVGI